MHGATLSLRPSQHPEFSSLHAMSFSPYVLRHSHQGAGLAYHSSGANQDPLGVIVTITRAPVLALGFGSIT